MSKEFELKPCPFCGGGASIEVAWAPDTDGGEMECRLIICHGCNAQMQDEVENLAELVGKWNTRHDFTAGHALGRREMEGEVRDKVAYIDNNIRCSDDAWDALVTAIEAIPGEV